MKNKDNIPNFIHNFDINVSIENSKNNSTHTAKNNNRSLGFKIKTRFLWDLVAVLIGVGVIRYLYLCDCQDKTEVDCYMPEITHQSWNDVGIPENEHLNSDDSQLLFLKSSEGRYLDCVKPYAAMSRYDVYARKSDRDHLDGNPNNKHQIWNLREERGEFLSLQNEWSRLYLTLCTAITLPSHYSEAAPENDFYLHLKPKSNNDKQMWILKKSGLFYELYNANKNCSLSVKKGTNDPSGLGSVVSCESSNDNEKNDNKWSLDKNFFM